MPSKEHRRKKSVHVAVFLRTACAESIGAVIRQRALCAALVCGATCLLAISSASARGPYNLDEYEKVTGKRIEKYAEAPMLKARVAAGKLPPLRERLPANPLVIEPWEEIGRHGGTLKCSEVTISYCHYLRHLNDALLLEIGPSSVYPRWGGPGGPIRPGIFEWWEVGKDAKTFTFRIRNGLKWSDGVPVTTEDVRYTIEDVLFNEEITPLLPGWARWGGKRAKFEVIDPSTFRLKLAKPFGTFIYDIRSSRWHSLIRPKHYLKQFHKRYTPIEKIEPIMKQKGYSKDEWGRFYGFMDTWYAAGRVVVQPDVMNYPTLDPYVVVANPQAGEFILERNPYFYEVDTAGNQLPYIDRLHRTMATNLEIQNMKILAGETDMQGQFLKLSDYPLFMRNRKKGGYNVMLLKAAGSQLGVVLNLCPNDLVLRKIVQDVRFRQAVSLALDREEIRETLFLGFGRPAQATTTPGNEFFEEAFEKPYIEYDPERANALLDEMGLSKRDKESYRLRPDGKKLMLQLIYYDVTPPASAGAELVSEYLRAIGISVPVLQVNGQRHSQLRNSNQVNLMVWAVGGSVTSPHGFAGFALPAWLWWKWYDTDGEQGVEPLPAAKRVFALRDILLSTVSEEERIRAGKEILRIQAENLWVIATVVDVPKPFVYSRRLANIGVAEKRNYDTSTVLEAAEQWFFKE